MAKKKTKSDALALPVNASTIIQRSHEVGALAKREDVKELMNRQSVYERATRFFKATAKRRATFRSALLEAAACDLRTKIQIGSILQELGRGNDITDTTYEDFLQENLIARTQAVRWRDMGYKMAKKLHLKSVVDETLKFTPDFLKRFEIYIKECADDPSEEAVPNFNGFVEHLHEGFDARQRKERERILVVFCRNLHFAKAEELAKEIRESDHLDITQDRWDTLVWQPILDKRNLFFGQAVEMNRRDKEKAAASEISNSGNTR